VVAQRNGGRRGVVVLPLPTRAERPGGSRSRRAFAFAGQTGRPTFPCVRECRLTWSQVVLAPGSSKQLPARIKYTLYGFGRQPLEHQAGRILSRGRTRRPITRCRNQRMGRRLRPEVGPGRTHPDTSDKGPCKVCRLPAKKRARFGRRRPI